MATVRKLIHPVTRTGSPRNSSSSQKPADNLQSKKWSSHSDHQPHHSNSPKHYRRATTTRDRTGKTGNKLCQTRSAKTLRSRKRPPPARKFTTTGFGKFYLNPNHTPHNFRWLVDGSIIGRIIDTLSSLQQRGKISISRTADSVRGLWNLGARVVKRTTTTKPTELLETKVSKCSPITRTAHRQTPPFSANIPRWNRIISTLEGTHPKTARIKSTIGMYLVYDPIGSMEQFTLSLQPTVRYLSRNPHS